MNRKKICKENDLQSIGKGERPNLDDEKLKKNQDVIIGSRLAGTVISRKMVVAIGTGVAKANQSSILREFGGALELTEGWAQNVLKDMDWVKRRGKTGKVESCPKFLEEKKLTFQCAISKFVSDHDIPLELVLNLEQTPLFYVSHGKYAFNLNDSKTVPIKGVDDKLQITATFTVTASGSFLPLQFIYSGITIVIRNGKIVWKRGPYLAQF